MAGAPQVNVFEPRTNNWTLLQLPHIFTTSIINIETGGSYVLFVFGFGGMPEMVVYNTRTNAMNLVQLSFQLFHKVMTISGDRSIFITAQRRELVVVDLIQGTEIAREDASHLNQYQSAISNGQLIFFSAVTTVNSVPVIACFNLTSMEWIYQQEINRVSSTVTRLFIEGDTLYGVQLSYTITIRNLSQGLNGLVVNRVTTQSRDIRAVVLVDGRAYIVTPARVTVYDPMVFGAVTLYSFSGNDNMEMTGAVQVDGVIYATGTSEDIAVISKFDTKAYLQPLRSMQQYSLPYFIERDLMFWLANPPVIYNFRTQSQTQYDGLVMPSRVDKLLMNDIMFLFGESDYFAFEFATENWTVSKKPESCLPHTFDATNTTAAFTIDDRIHFYNALSNEWTWIVLNGSVWSVRSKGDDLVFLQTGRIVIFDAKLHSWSSIDVKSRDHSKLFLFGSVAIIAGGWINNTPSKEVIVLNLNSKEVLTLQMSVARSDVEVIFVANSIVLMGGWTSQDREIIDIYDMYKSQMWRQVLPRAPSQSVKPLAVRDSLFIAYLNRVDSLNVPTRRLSAMPGLQALGQVYQMIAIGSKVIVHSFYNMDSLIFIFETTTLAWTSIDLYQQRSTVGGVELLHNYVVTFNSMNVEFMPISALTNMMQSKELFLGESANFTVTSLGSDIRYSWQRNSNALMESSNVLLITNFTEGEEGTYKVTMIDGCNHHMIDEASLTVIPIPTFITQLQDSVILCTKNYTLPMNVIGRQTSVQWTVNGRIQQSKNQSLIISTQNMECDSRSTICVTASNPSGSAEMCSQVRFMHLDSLVVGPSPVVVQSTWFAEDEVDLSIQIVDEDCSQHTWFVNDNPVSNFTSLSSSHRVSLSASMEENRYYVKIQCGNNVIESNTFIFGRVSSLPIWGLVLIILGIAVTLCGVVVLVIVFRKTMDQSHNKEVELSTLLSKAKTESLKKEAMPIIQTTTWEWTPSDEYSYRSINNLPIAIDTSQLRFSDKEDPLEVGMFHYRSIKFEQKKKPKKRSMMKERLINGGTKIDIYAPQSPKYQVIVDPSSLVLEDSVDVTISIQMRMTTKCNVTLVIVLEQQHIYSAIEFKLTSKMSTWVDVEEIEMTGDFLGGGG
jgi:hypothetical protein